MSVTYDRDINKVLELASNEELEILVKLIKDRTLSQTLTIEDEYQKYYKAKDHSKYTNLIAKHIRLMGGHTFANLARKHEGPLYEEIVRDVAKKLKVKFNTNAKISEIESAILEKVLHDSFEKMTESDKLKLCKEFKIKEKHLCNQTATVALLRVFKTGKFGSYKMLMITANQVARFATGSGLSLATNAFLNKSAKILAGPIGIYLTAIWSMYDLGKESYKTTIPAVIHIAILRKIQNEHKFLFYKNRVFYKVKRLFK